MTTPRPTDPQPRREDAAKDERSRPDEKAAGAEQKQASDYVFKIVPVDPKNAFEYEDVADK
jgi:hypothetical protein